MQGNAIAFHLYRHESRWGSAGLLIVSVMGLPITGQVRMIYLYDEVKTDFGT